MRFLGLFAQWLTPMPLLFLVASAGCSHDRSATKTAGLPKTPPRAEAAPYSLEDPLRWMEQGDSPSFADWLHREGNDGARFLEQLPERPWFFRTLTALNAERAEALRVVPSAAGDFILLGEPGRPSTLVRLRDHSGNMTVVVESSPGATIEHIAPSPDGRYLVYVESRGGSDSGFAL